MKKLFATGAVVVLASLGAVGLPAPARSASDQKPVHATTARQLSGTFMVGDSTTYRIAPRPAM